MGRSKMTLGRLAELSPLDLKTEWARRYGTPAPNISPELVRMGLAYKLQEQRLGGLNRAARTVMCRADPVAAKTKPVRALMPGTKLVRDWHGNGHTVTVVADGFEYDGRQWRSLSAIAKAITGVKWNGPRFFGLAERKK
jgi:hypothetical protein